MARRRLQAGRLDPPVGTRRTNTHMESECKKAGGDKTSDVRLRDAAGLGRGEVDVSETDSEEATRQCRKRA